MVALAFATQYRKTKHQNKNAVVWCLNPIKFNKNVRFGTYTDEPIPNICESQDVAQMYKENVRIKNPIAIYGPYNNERILAQKGVFTLFPTCESFCMEEMENAEEYLIKIIIDRDCVKNIAEELYFIGCNDVGVKSQFFQ